MCSLLELLDEITILLGSGIKVRRSVHKVIVDVFRAMFGNRFIRRLGNTDMTSGSVEYRANYVGLGNKFL